MRTVAGWLVALLLGTLPGSAQTTYTDPNGRFSVRVPAGWQTSTDPASGQLTITNGPVSASLGVGRTNNGSTPKAEDVLAAVEKQAQPSCPGARVTQRGPANIAGFPGAYLFMSCNDANGQTTLKLSVATSEGNIIVFNTTGPTAEYSHAAPVLAAMAQTFRLGTAGRKANARAGDLAGGDENKSAALEEACATGVFTPEECAAKRVALRNGAVTQQPARAASQPEPNASSTLYRDPQSRFEVAIPSGWTAEPQGDNGSQGVKLATGASWAFIGPFSGATNPSDVVVKLATQIQSQYRDFTMLKHAPLEVNGHAAEYAVFNGASPQGTRVTLMIGGIAGGANRHLGMITSTPLATATQSTSAFVAMFNSIRFAGDTP